MIYYSYQKCEGYKLYGDDFLPVRELCMVYRELIEYLNKKTHQFRLVILRLGSKLEDAEREDYTLIYKDLAMKLEALHKERIDLEVEIAKSFDELLLYKIASNNGSVRTESNRNHNGVKGPRVKFRQ